MVCAFLLPTRSCVKVLGSAMDAAVARGHEVGLWVGPSTKEPWQPGDLDRWSACPRWINGVTIGLATDPAADVGVPSWWDNILAPPPPRQRVTGYLSPWHRDMHARNFPDHAARIQGQPVIGWTMADHRALLQHEPGKGPAFLDVFFTRKHRPPWHARGTYFDAVWRARSNRIRKGSFVIKTRAKHADPWWLRFFGPVIGDQCLYPSTSMALLSHAVMAYTFNSGAALEARLFAPLCQLYNRPIPMDHLAHLPGVLETYRHMLEDPLEDVISYDDTKAGERVMDLAESL